MKIFKFSCPLHFANVELFNDFITDYYLSLGSVLAKVEVGKNANGKEVEKPAHTLVIDGGAIAYVDSMGTEALQNAFADGKRVNVNVLYADFSGKF